ncbi:uncharacterized protein BJ171DRAFT_421767, partial [Polychytrium aggregatum]|uniref:uncharacterized protein n=1 Tax=Polychytrium aggregatum TaxID=110093 RepID=UPI0022FF2AC3
MSSLASAPALDRKKYPCPTCHLSFRRSEHLSRHLLTHSGAKPFLCHICSRSFSRLDAVQRHVKTH